MGLLHIENKAVFQKEVLESDKVALVDFWAPWCGPCRMIGPVIEELAGEYSGKAVIAKINVDDVGDLASEYGVMSIPTLIYFKGGKEVKRLVGSRPKADLVKESRDEISHDEDFECLRDYISKLPSKYRDVLSLMADGRSEKEISAKLDIKCGTVKSRSHRARAMLKEIMEEDNYEFTS